MRLTVETGPMAGTVVPLDRDQPAVLGSDPDCAIRIQQPGVHGQHAVVKALKGSGFGIKALHPGLRLNGAEVEASPLQDGDVLELGTTRIAFGQTQQKGLPTIPGYRILDVLGKGGMGIVYRAEQVSLHRQVALKVLNHERTRDAGFVAKFVAEARAAAKLQHPNVVSVFDVDQDSDTYYMAMELMHDGSLEDWLKQRGAMPVEQALRVIADAARGLAYAESLGIVHRDIKPDNLMLDQHGSVKIADLGLASTAEETEERAIGTPHFMAPEQVLKQDIDHRTDLYALGCTFYRLVTGKTPFRGSTVKDILRAQVKSDAEPAHKANPEVPAEVSAIIQHLMAKDPAARYQTANALLEDLDVLLQPPVKRGIWIALAATAVLVAGGAIWWAVTKPKEKEIVEKVYDDPEKQQFADEIKRLNGVLRERDAAIALFTVRTGQLTGEPLAAAFDQVAATHAGTPAADEARERAVVVRRDLEAAEQRAAARRAEVAARLDELRRKARLATEQRQFRRARQALDETPPAGMTDEPGWRDGVAALRAEITGAAEQHLAQLREPLDKARAAVEEASLATAIETLRQALPADDVWPIEMANAVTSLRNDLATAETELDGLRRARVDNVWQSYDALVAEPGAMRTALRQLDFATAARLASEFGAGAAAQPVAERAGQLAAVLQLADAFLVALQTAVDGGKMQVPIDGNTFPAVRWQRAERQIVWIDPARRTKENQLSIDALLPDDWAMLTDQLEGAPPGSRECFLTVVTLEAHARAAQALLARLRPADPESGVGEDGYPYSAARFDRLQHLLPQPATAPWQQFARDELQAGRRLAAGLRALAERRNLAAADHLEKLLRDHPHSLLVAGLP